MNNSIFHILIIWSTALKYKDHIISDINNNFKLQKVFNIHWNPDMYYKNLKIFYSHSLKDFSNKRMDKILKEKIHVIGKEDFVAVIFEDCNPCFEERKTSSGFKKVNRNVFDKKMEYRELAGGCRIHGSDDAWETNKDLTILFGLNTEDFCKKYPTPEENEDYYSANCQGVDGFQTIEQLFYVLNNTIRYVVLRNHECLPATYTVEGHGDIDLLVEHKEYAVRLTGARGCFKESYRVYHHINIAGENYPFDFRYIGDNYYDPKWEETILDSRVQQKRLFFTPNLENQFYSLLYHAFIQKPEVKKDYIPKLSNYARMIGVSFNSDIKEAIPVLSSFLKEKGYIFTNPADKSVYFNKKNVSYCNSWNLLCKDEEIDGLEPCNLNYTSLSDYSYFTGYYNGVKIFVKMGGIGDSCKNEYIFARKAYNTNNDYFVRPLFLKEMEGTYYIAFEYITGVTIESYLTNYTEQQKEQIKCQLVNIYNILKVCNIMHRDIRPDNLIVVEDHVKLLDFQFAIDTKLRKELKCLSHIPTILLGMGDSAFRYKPNAWSDSYSMNKVLKHLHLKTGDIDENDCEPFYMSPWIWYRYINKERLKHLKRLIKTVFSRH